MGCVCSTRNLRETDGGSVKVQSGASASRPPGALRQESASSFLKSFARLPRIESSACSDDRGPGSFLRDSTFEDRRGDEWQNEMKGTAAAAAVMPFVPTRISAAFARGLLTTTDAAAGSTGTTAQGAPVSDRSRRGLRQGAAFIGNLAKPRPAPRQIQAACLLVDVSGFSRLSEQACRRAGSAEAEGFAFAISEFFSQMTVIIDSFGGDIDCFAGDALLVLFCSEDGEACGASSASSTDRHCQGRVRRLARAAARAFDCACDIHTQLDNFRLQPDDPQLRVHSGIAAGELYSLECGGNLAERSEALVLGEPLIELGAALRRANMREIALAPSARKLLTAMPEVTMVACHGKPSRKSASETGLFTMANIPFSVARSSPHRSAVMMPTPVWRLSHSWSVGHSTRKSLSASGPDSKHLVRQVAAHAKVLCKLAACAAKRTSGNRSRSQSSTLSRSSSSSQRSSSMDVGIGGALSGSQGSDSNFNHVLREDSLAGMPCLRRAQGAGAEAMDGQGLGAILRFMPSFVRGKHDTEEGLQSLEEHRAVTVLFVIANVEAHRARFADMEWQIKLQETLGAAIDLVEGRLGGATRQITVDDKGLAMIFVFGLPGYSGQAQQPPALAAGNRIVELMQRKADIVATAGVTSGICFCGVIGNPKIRCEYAVLGDVVNTAARLAGAAIKLGERVLCSDTVAHAAKEQCAAFGLSLEAVGDIPLKGKAGLAPVFALRPDTLLATSRPRPSRMSPPLWVVLGREEELATIHSLLRRPSSRCSTPLQVVIVEGSTGMGKKALLDEISRSHLDTNRQGEGSSPWPYQMLRLRVLPSHGFPVPFLIAHDILVQLLQLLPGDLLGGAGSDWNPEEVAWLLGDFELESWHLPSVMRPYIDRLAGLRMILEGNQLDLARRSLYAEITWDALSRMTLPVLLLLDDVHELDEDSAAVMVAVVERGCSGPQRSAAPYRAHAADQPNNAIIMSSQRPITRQSMDDNGQPTCHPLQELPGVLLLKLSPLQDRDVEALACLTLECSSLAPPIRDAILRQAQGVPLYAVEAANWLRRKGLVTEGGQLSASADLAAAIPPSLQNIVQLEVDALPPGPGAVLRCASVLGSPLSQDMLLELVPRAVATCEEALGVELELLEAYGMLYRVAAESVPLATEGAGSTAEEASDGTGSRGGGGFWAFRHQLHCDVVYRSIAHVHRRSLHRRAALLLGKRLVAVPEQPQARQLLWEQARHLEKVLLCHTAGHSYGIREKGDINALARVLESMASHAEATGCWKEAYDHRSRLLGILQEIFGGKPTVWQCRMELHAVQQLLGAITRAADNGIAVCTEQRRHELAAMQPQLLQSGRESMEISGAGGWGLSSSPQAQHCLGLHSMSPLKHPHMQSKWWSSDSGTWSSDGDGDGSVKAPATPPNVEGLLGATSIRVQDQPRI